MEPLLFDRSEKQIGRLLPDLVSPTEIEDLGGENRLLFTYPSGADWAESIAEGHLVACQDMDRNWQLYEIAQVRDQIGTVEAICEHAYYSLSGMEFVNATCEGSALTALTTVLASTGWKPGTVEIQTARTCLFEHMNPLAAITKIAEHWGGELRFRVEISGASIVGKYVDLLTRRGDVTGKRFEFGRDVKDIDITLDRTGVVTALYGWGQGEGISEDGEDTERLTMADAEWTEGQDAELHPDGLTSPAPADKPLGQLWVGDEAARLAYGRYDPATGQYRHIFGEYESQAKSPQALTWETWRQLQKRCEPLVNIKATVASLEQIPGFEHEKVRLGDTCYVILPDISPLAARVIRIVRQRKDPGQTQIELGNFRPVQGERIADIERRVRRADSRSGVWDRARVVNPDGTLPTSVLDGPIDAVQNQIKAGGGEVLMDEEGFRVLDTGDPDTALAKIHGVARDGEAALVLGKRDSPLDPWAERVGMTSAGFQIHAEEVVAGTFTGDRLHIGAGVGFDTGYDPTEKETPSGAQGKANAAASAAEAAAKDYAEEKAAEAQAAAEAVAYSESERQAAEALATAEEIAQGYIGEETQARLDQAEANLEEAKTYAAGQAEAAEAAAKAYAEEQAQAVESRASKYMTFDPATGLRLGAQGSPSQIVIDNRALQFLDLGGAAEGFTPNPDAVAYLHGQKFYVSNIEAVNSLLVGNHLIEKLDGNITIVRWVG